MFLGVAQKGCFVEKNIFAMSKPRIRYRVKARLYNPGKDCNDLILVDRFFEEDNPFDARIKAFNFFKATRMFYWRT